MLKITILALLVVVAAVTSASGDTVKTYVCEGYYGCEKCCPRLGSGCGKFKASPSWFGSYMEICACSCPDGVVPYLGDSIRELTST